MPLNSDGYSVVGLPRVPPAVPREHAAVRYRMCWTADDDWFFERRPGDGARAGCFDPALVPAAGDYTPLLRHLLGGFALGTADDWSVRVQRRPPAGHPVHQDGVDLMLIARLGGADGGEVRLSRAGGGPPVWRGALEPGRAVLFDDRALAHEIAGAETQDLLIAAFERGSSA